MDEFLRQFVSNLGIALIFVSMLVGLFGLIIPIFPGGVVIWLAAGVYGIAYGFGTAGGILFAVITLLMLASAAADNVLMAGKAREAGASWRAIIVALVAGILGTLFFPPFGGLIAAPLGLFVMEYMRFRETDKAFEVTRGLLIGCGWSFVVRFGLGVVMIVLWGVWFWGSLG